MKKLGLLIMPLMAVSLLASCEQPKQAVQHFVTFESNGGSHIDTQRVDDGGTATDPGASTKPGYDFKGWYTTNPNPTPIEEDKYNFDAEVTDDITLYAGWISKDVNHYDFSFTCVGCTINTYQDHTYEDIEEGTNLQYTILPNEDHKTPTVTFRKGSECATYSNGIITITNMDRDVEIEATAEEKEIKYTIGFSGVGCKASGEIVSETTSDFQVSVLEDTEITLTIAPDDNYELDGSITFLVNNEPADPTSYTKSDNNYVLVFTLNGNTHISIQALPIDPSITYTVTWLDYDGTVLEEDTEVEEGATPSCSVTPSRESDAYHRYAFNKWLPEVSEVHSNQTYVASYNETHYDTQVYMKVNITEEAKTIDIDFKSKSGSTAPIIYWGDDRSDASKSHTYTDVGEYKVRIVGQISSVAMGNNGKSALEELYLGPTINTIESEAFKNCNNLKSVSFFEQSGITEIKGSAFMYCPIASITIPSSVKTIGTSAFENCPLNSVTFKDDSILETISDRAFAYPNFESVIIPKTVKTIGYGAFGTMTPAFQSKLISVTFKNGTILETIGGDAFYRSKIPSIFIPKTVKTIGDDAFDGCNKLVELTIETGSALENLGDGAFYETAIESIMIPKGVKSIGKLAFMGCSKLTSITFEAGTVVESIGEYAFCGTPIQFIMIPKTVKTIGPLAFSSCKKLLSVTFESGSVLESINQLAFEGCKILASVEMVTITTPPILGENVFSGVAENIVFNIKKGTKTLYMNAAGWKEFNEAHFIEAE